MNSLPLFTCNMQLYILLAKFSKKLHIKCWQNLIQENLRNLAKFDTESALQRDILDVLQEGLRAFGQLKEQWIKLLAFFQVLISVFM